MASITPSSCSLGFYFQGHAWSWLCRYFLDSSWLQHLVAGKKRAKERLRGGNVVSFVDLESGLLLEVRCEREEIRREAVWEYTTHKQDWQGRCGGDVLGMRQGIKSCQ